MPCRRFSPGEDLLDCRSTSPGAYLVRAGFACRYHMFPNGRRQIIGFVLPGDLCDSRATMFDRVDYSVSAIDTVEAFLIPADKLIGRTSYSTSLLRALCRLTAVEDAIDRQWLLNIGHRSAVERVAHLLCEIFTRLRSVGLARENACDLPLSQTDIADATALTPVHVNRMLMDLRRKGIIGLNRRQLIIHEFQVLQSIGGFSARYLMPHELEESRIPSTPAEARDSANGAHHASMTS